MNDPNAPSRASSAPRGAAPSPLGNGATSNGASGEREDARRYERMAELFRPLPVQAQHLRAFPEMPGADEEPWDVLIGSIATDEQSALQALGELEGGRRRRDVDVAPDNI